MNICPECKAGKHSNCLGDAWDFEHDVPTVCDCWISSHIQSTETEQPDDRNIQPTTRET